MGGGISVNQEAIASLKEESTKPTDLSDNPSAIIPEIIKIRTLMAEFIQFKQFEQEQGKPLDVSDISDDGKAELTRIRGYLGTIFAQDNYKKIVEKKDTTNTTTDTTNITTDLTTNTTTNTITDTTPLKKLENTEIGVDTNAKATLAESNDTTTNSNTVASTNNENNTFSIGQRVRARFAGKGHFYNGKITAINEDGTFYIEYDDGDFEDDAKSINIKAIETKTVVTENTNTTKTEVETSSTIATNNDKDEAISTDSTAAMATATTAMTSDGEANSNTSTDLKTAINNDAIITVPNENDVKETITATTTSE
jgi:hypothetical protein